MSYMKNKAERWNKLRDIITKTDKAILRKVVESINGHSIYPPEFFTEMGLDADVVMAFCEKIKSDFRDPKQTIYQNNEPVKSMTGVVGLSLLSFIAGCYGVDSYKMGRGSRANHLAEQLLNEHLQD